VELHARELIQLFGLLIGVGALLVLAPIARVPYPILMVVGGLLLSFVPGLPDFRLPPELVLVAFLPPLLYLAAFFTSLRDVRANIRPIGLLSIGLVAVTTVLVGVVAHEVVDGLPWSAAFVLGAVVSPTDPIAATSIARRLGAPRRVVTIVEGESLVNDATALVLYRVAVVAVTTGAFSLWEAGARLVVNALAGVAIGLAVGYVVRQVRKRMSDPPSEIAVSLLTPYLAYLPAEALGVSAVLAAVTVGIYLGWYTPEVTNAETRLQGFAFWTILTFILNAALFTLVGLQLPSVLEGLDAWSTQELVVAAAAVCATVIGARIAWVLVFAYLDPRLKVRNAAIAAWAGMRGAVALAAALAIPLETDAGAPFPDRELIIFLAFSVILVTLVGQGLTLPALIRALHVEDDGLDAAEEAKARKLAAMAALARLDEIENEDWVMSDTAGRLRGLYDFRVRRFGERFHESDGTNEAQSVAYQRLRRELLDAERAAVLGLRRDGVVSDDVMNRVLRDIALEDVRLDFER
jgi:Na+/H+ antiporter